MRSVFFIVAVFVLDNASAQEVPPQTSELRTAIDRGLAFLVKDALAWKNEHNCASCHHASLMVWAMREAKRRGHVVDEPVLADLTNWMAASGDGKFSVARPTSAPKAASPKAIYFAIALGTDPKRDAAVQAGLRRLLTTVRSEQTENGSWSAWPGSRPPILGNSDDSLTALAALAVLPAAAAGDKEAKAALDRGVEWLAETKTDDDPQSVALRVVLWRTLNRPAKEWEPLVKRIKDHQNADGGWSQTKDMASDAWASGQALFALADVDIKSNQAAISRGQAFLLKSQRADGSWSMSSRPTVPGGKGSTSLVPITGAGSAWAILGLVRSTVPAEPVAAPDLGSIQ